MVNRRNFLAAVGATAAGGAAAIGTGAFTSVSAERVVSVDVVADENAYLGLEAIDERASNGNDGGELQIDFSSSNNGSEGLNPDSRTAFTDLFRITNQGDNDVVVGVGTNRADTYKNPGSNGNAKNLIFDEDGLSGFVYAEEDGDGIGLGTEFNNGFIRIDSGGRVDLEGKFQNPDFSDRTLAPGESFEVDLSVITSEDPPYVDGDTSMVVLAAEPGSDRDFSDEPDGKEP